MSTDRELLELAAKAAGIDLDGGVDEHGVYEENWNPITDGGVRYRLAKKLDILINFGSAYASFYKPDGTCGVMRWPEDAEDDVYAIVRAAAEIGRAMP